MKVIKSQHLFRMERRDLAIGAFVAIVGLATIEYKTEALHNLAMSLGLHQHNELNGEENPKMHSIMDNKTNFDK